MPEKTIRLARAILFLIVAIMPGLIPVVSLSARQDDPEIAIEEGVISDLRDELKLLLMLAENKDSRLELDRRTWAGHMLSTDERKKELAERYGDRLPAEQIDQMVEQLVSHRKSGFLDLVENLAKAAHYSGMSGSSEQTVYHAENLNIVVRASKDYHELNLEETSGPKRSLRVSDDSAGEFKVLLLGDDYLVEINQIPERPLKIVMIIGEDIFQSRTGTFREFVEQHPRRCDQLLKILDNVGFNAPPMLNSPAVSTQVIRNLAAILDSDASDEFDRLLSALDSGLFEMRKQTRKLLVKEFSRFEPLIRQKAAESSTTAEMKSALNSIISVGAGSEVDSRIDDFIAARSLMNSPEYLGSLLARADEDERELIFKQLERVTGETFGNDIEALHRYLKGR